MAASRQYQDGQARRSGPTVIEDTLRYLVDAETKQAALSDPDLPMSGDPHPEFGNLVAIDFSAQRYTPETFMVDVRYGRPDSPQITPPPDRDAQGYDEQRNSTTSENIKFPRIYSQKVLTPVPLLPSEQGPPQDPPPEIESVRWVRENVDVRRTVEKALRQVNVELYDVTVRAAIAAQVGRIHDFGPGDDNWVFRGHEAQRVSADGRWSITYRWTRAARLPAVPDGGTDQVNSDGTIIIGVPELPVNHVYDVVSEFVAPADQTRPLVTTRNPYEDGSFTALPGIGG